MNDLARRMLSATSKPPARAALLVLEDGTFYHGTACGASGETFGEICVNTSLEGYLEVITDPSYAGQIVTMTYPQIGNYGVCSEDAQDDHPVLRGLVVRDMCYTPSNWRSEITLPQFLEREGIIAIEGIDTRALVRHIRTSGAMNAVISTEDLSVESLLAKVRTSEPLVGVNLVQQISCEAPYSFGIADLRPGKMFAHAPAVPTRYHVVAYDCGAKRSILEELVRVGCNVEVVPWDTPADDVLSMAPDGVFVSNGPGDPDAVMETSEQVRRLLGKVPVFGICMGHQMICKAAGAHMEKLKFGHHGGNHPVMNLLTGRVEITAQNHGFNVDFASLGNACNDDTPDRPGTPEQPVPPIVENERFGRVVLTHVNLNDDTAEGIAFLDIPAFSVQYHPEANPGPTDAHYLFTAFTRLMDGRKDYLDIDIARDRLQGWRF